MSGLGASLAMAVFVLAVPSSARSGTDAPRGPVRSTKVAEAMGALDAVEAQLDRASRQWHAVRQQAEARRNEAAPAGVPRSLLRRIDGLDRRVEAASRPLRHHPWAEVQPVLQRAELVRRRLHHLRDALAAPTASPSWRVRGRSPASGSGRITGHVVDARTGVAIDAEIDLFDSSGSWLDTYPAAGGAYVVDGLAGGTYFLRADNVSGVDYVAELYDDIACDPYCSITSGTPVVVHDGQTTPAINFGLVPFSSVQGTVTSAMTGQPVQGTDLSLYDAQGSEVAWATSGADGTYVFTRVAPGVHFATAEDPYYLDQLYSGMACQPGCSPESGTPILVGQAATVTGIDFPMQLGGSISGTVIDQGDGGPANAEVEIYDSTGNWVEYTWTAGTGEYQVFDLPTGTYYAATWSWDYADELYDDIPCEASCTVTTGTPIPVTQGQQHGGVSFALAPVAGGISGTVTDAANGVPIEGVQVYGVDAAGNWDGSTSTSSAGHYRLAPLSAGSYYVLTSNDRYVDEVYDDIVCEPTCVPSVGRAVTVTAGADTPDVDFALDFGGWISGRVTTQGGGLVEYGSVSVYAGDGSMLDWVYTDTTGAYVARGLVTGSYFAVADGEFTLDQLYRDLPCPSGCDPTTGTPIPVTTGQATAGIDFTLHQLGRISGRVTEAVTGLPVYFPYIHVYDASGQPSGYGLSVDGMGYYTIHGLPAGTYFVTTESWSNYVDQLYANKTCEPSCDVTQGTPVVVALDSTTAGIDFSLKHPTFADVPVDHWAWKWVEAAYAAGLTGGCATGPLRFCPDASVTRDQSSVVLLRAKDGAAYLPPPATGVFQDLPPTNPFAPWVEELVRRGVTTGCSTNPPLFCPAWAVTRAQSGPFLLRTHDGATYVPPPAVGVFDDVPASDPFAPWVEDLVRRGVTAGCSTSPSLFCPGSSVTRAQFAVFLGKAFGLTLP